jgi:GTP-binding protein
MDMPEAEENLQAFKEKLQENVKIFPISAVTRQGVRDLLFAVADLLENTSEFPLQQVEEEESARVMYKFEKADQGFKITRESDGSFVVSGAEIEKLFKMTNFERDEAVRRFARQMRGMGIDEALRERGAANGDIVKILEYEFEFIE